MHVFGTDSFTRELTQMDREDGSITNLQKCTTVGEQCVRGATIQTTSRTKIMEAEA